MTREEIYKKQGSYKTQGFQGKKGVKMILEMDKNTGATVLSPVNAKSKALDKMKSKKK